MSVNGELADDPMRMMCSNCEARITHTHTKWANQYGESVRFFCHECGMWEDRKHLYDGGFEATTVHQGIPEAEAVEGLKESE